MTHAQAISRQSRRVASLERTPAIAKVDLGCLIMDMFGGGGTLDCGSGPLLTGFFRMLGVWGDAKSSS